MPAVTVTTTVKVEGLPETICVEVAPGQFCFTTDFKGSFAWKFNEREAPPAFNFAMYAEGKYRPQMRVRSLEVAVIYAWGFVYGYRNGHTHGQEEKQGVEKMVEQHRLEGLGLKQ